MSQSNHSGQQLGSLPIRPLFFKFAVPSIVAMLVSAAYNIVDQFFIGQRIGILGNAATNVAFPMANACTAIALLLGIGASAAFNLSMGRGEHKKAGHFVGGAIALLMGGGVLLMTLTLVFLRPLIAVLGASGDVVSYAETYIGITAIGFPFLVFSIGSAHLIRADGRPTMSMMCNILGAVVNTVLDAWFVFGAPDKMTAMAGAAWATVIGQIVSAGFAAFCLLRFRTVKITKGHLIPRPSYIGTIASLGTAPFFNQLAMMVVQIVLNNTLSHYGALSPYGADIPLACAGIIMKVCQLLFGIVIGMSQAMQPIVSFNYGAKQFARVRKTFLLACGCALIVSVTAATLFFLFPRQIVSLFSSGDESEMYYLFAERYFRIFLFFTFINFVQPIASTFFTAVGKAFKGAFLSLTRQILFLLPLLIVFPLLFGIDGVMYAAPVSDLLALICASVMMILEWRHMKRQEATLTA